MTTHISTLKKLAKLLWLALIGASTAVVIWIFLGLVISGMLGIR